MPAKLFERRERSDQTKNNSLFYMYKLNINMNPVGASLLWFGIPTI
jgi:hypothetical protein